MNFDLGSFIAGVITGMMFVSIILIIINSFKREKNYYDLYDIDVSNIKMPPVKAPKILNKGRVIRYFP